MNRDSFIVHVHAKYVDVDLAEIEKRFDTSNRAEK